MEHMLQLVASGKDTIAPHVRHLDIGPFFGMRETHRRLFGLVKSVLPHIGNLRYMWYVSPLAS
jgi:hypothetical protein